MSQEKLTIKTEAELCAAFIEQFNAIEGWTCYPETAGFDVLVVHEDGRQIGVEAKLKLNAKVADQIIPSGWHARYGTPGPDHRLVIVGTISDANEGIAKMLGMMGVEVLAPRMSRMRGEFTEYGSTYKLAPDFQLESFLSYRGAESFGQPHLFDWNPPERCVVPCVVPDVPAGVPAPLRLTPWKESALKVLIQLRKQGYITAKQITAHGISSTIWTQGKTAWLCKGETQGQWVATDRLPAFDKQHPGAYEKLMDLTAAEELAAMPKEPTQAGLDLNFPST